MTNDELLDTLQETIAEAKATGADRRANTERRSGRPANYGGPERRRSDSRRSGIERRDNRERRAGLDRRYSLRRNEDQQAFQKRVEEGELTLEEVEFVRAVDRYKRKFNRPFPTWSEVLAIVKELGYTRGSLS